MKAGPNVLRARSNLEVVLQCVARAVWQRVVASALTGWRAHCDPIHPAA